MPCQERSVNARTVIETPMEQEQLENCEREDIGGKIEEDLLSIPSQSSSSNCLASYCLVSNNDMWGDHTTLERGLRRGLS